MNRPGGWLTRSIRRSGFFSRRSFPCEGKIKDRFQSPKELTPASSVVLLAPQPGKLRRTLGNQ
jgi:hypothetical protein